MLAEFKEDLFVCRLDCCRSIKKVSVKKDIEDAVFKICLQVIITVNKIYLLFDDVNFKV